MNILAFNGSPRPRGNSPAMLAQFRRGAEENHAVFEEVITHQARLEYCTGCLRCNLIKRCSIKNDDWPSLSEKILNADTLVFASPVYFHHFPAPLKKIIDRFRSFMHVQMTETGLIHTPWVQWRKHFVLLLSLGHQTADDTQPIIDLLNFMLEVLGPENQLTTIIGTGLGKAGQVSMNQTELLEFYKKIKMPEHLAEPHFQRNQELLEKCYQLGKNISINDKKLRNEKRKKTNGLKT